MRKKQLLSSLVLFSTSTIIFLLSAEAFFRLFQPQQESMRWCEYSPQYGHVLKKNFSQDYPFLGDDFVMHVETNSLGHRDKECDQADFKDRSIKKVLLLGDSFMFGHGINMENHLATHLENMLNKNGQRFLIMNAGVSGWGTVQETTYAKDHFEQFHPDIVVLLFCGNDPDDDNRFYSTAANGQRSVFDFPGEVLLRDHSHLYRFIVNRFYLFLYNRVLKTKAKHNKNILIDRQSGNAITPEQWQRTLKVIGDFHDDFLSFNKEGVLLIMTTAPWYAEYTEKFKSLDNGRTLLFVDMYDETNSLPPDVRCLNFDGHWSAWMHYASAKKLSETILSLPNHDPAFGR